MVKSFPDIIKYWFTRIRPIVPIIDPKIAPSVPKIIDWDKNINLIFDLEAPREPMIPIHFFFSWTVIFIVFARPIPATTITISAAKSNSPLTKLINILARPTIWPKLNVS